MILKKCLGILSIEKSDSQPIKICTLVTYIFAYFPKVLTYDIGQKMAFFFFFSSWAIIILKFFGGGESFRSKTIIFSQKSQENVFMKKPFQKSKNIHLTRSKICISSYFRLRQNERRKSVYELSISKKPFLDQ